MHNVDYAIAKCLSVRTYVTRQYSIQTAKHIIKHFHYQVVIPFQFVHTNRYGLDWPTVMFDDFLHQLVSGSLPS